MIVDKITNALSGRYVQGSIRAFPHIRKLKLADDDMGAECQEVSILIGLEYYYDVINGGPIKVKGAPTVVPSIFGYVVSGNVGEKEGNGNCVTTANVSTALMIDHVSNEELLQEVRGFFEIESSGIKEEDEDLFEEEFPINIEKREDRYYVEYPFKNGHHLLCDNYRLTLKRLQGVCRRMTKDKELHTSYCEIMRDQEKNGIIEEVPSDADSVEDNKIYYMPQHPVIRRDKKTSRTRIVCDCSAKEDGSSLNE